MDARAAALIAILVLSSFAVAQSKCVACKDCGGNNVCLSTCQRECPAEPPTVNIESCKRYGEQAGKDSAAAACSLTLTYCNSGKSPRSARSGSPPRVSLGQCGAAAEGVCIAWANDAKKAPCGASFNGIGPCSRSEFQTFYQGVVGEQCNQKAAPFDKPQGKK